MTDKPKVTISDACDGFILVVECEGKVKRFYFDQEDTREGLLDFFKYIEIESVYEEDY